MASRNSTSSDPSEHLSGASTTALTTPDVEHGPILASKTPVISGQEVINALQDAKKEEALRGGVTTMDSTASIWDTPSATTMLSVTDKSLDEASKSPTSQEQLLSDHDNTSAARTSSAQGAAQPTTPPQGNRPKLTKFSTPVHPTEPLCRVFDPSADDEKTIEELLARRPGPGTMLRAYPTRPWDAEKERKERREDRDAQVAKLKKAAKELSELPYFKKA